MTILGLIVALFLFFHVKRRLEATRAQVRDAPDPRQSTPCAPQGAASWHDQWHRHWAEKWDQQAQRRKRHMEKHMQRELRRLEKLAKRFGVSVPVEPALAAASTALSSIPPTSEASVVVTRARRRAKAQAGFYIHLMSYLGVIALLCLINLMTTSYPWFLWPALGWGIGLFSHYMAVFGRHVVRERYFEPAVEREVRRERVALHTEKRATIDELSATIAHEIRNPIAAAKSLVQQMGEDPTSVENVEYAKVAVDKLDRVERRISHLLKYAKEEDYQFTPVNVSEVLDSALTQLRAKLDHAQVAVVRNYITGPTVVADAEKLRQVFTNVIDNAVDALGALPENRRLELFITNGSQRAVVRIKDNGPGIPADRIDRIFNPFFTTKDHGTGLGMAISKKIVEAHEGTIDVVSEPEHGAEFVVTLPMPQ